jgi:hypothetical protein
MTCEEVRDILLDELLGGGEVAVTAGTREHLESCPSCRAELTAMRGLINRVRALPTPLPDPAAMTAMRGTLLAAARQASSGDVSTRSPGIQGTASVWRKSRMDPRLNRFLTGAVAAAAGALMMLAAMRSSPAPAHGADKTAGTAMDVRPRFMLLLLDPEPSGAQSTEEVRRIIAEHHAWADRLRSEGRLVLAEKLSDDPGRLLGTARATDTLAYKRTGDRVGGFYIIRASDYDDAKRVARAGPALKFGGRVEIRQIEGN